MKICLVAAGALILLVAVGCRPKLVTEQNLAKHQYVVARAGDDYRLTMPELYGVLTNTQLLARGGVLTEDQVQHVLDSVIIDTLAGLKAFQINLAQHYNPYQTYKGRYHNRLIKFYFKRLVYDSVSVDSLEAVQFYHDRSDLFEVKGEQVAIRHIAISEKQLRSGPDSLRYADLSQSDLDTAVANYVWKIRRIADTASSFSEVALEYSYDKLVISNHGYLGWVPRGRFRPPFDSIAFSLEDGEISDPYKDADGWHIIRVEGHIGAGLQPLDSALYQSAMATLRTVKTNERGMKLMDSLRAEINLEYNEQILDTNVYFVEKQVWAGIVNGIDTINFQELSGQEERFRRQRHVDNTTIEMKKEILRLLAERYIIVQAARQAGFDSDPEIVEFRESLLHDYSKQIVLTERLDQTWTPSDSLLKAYYLAHIEEFRSEKPLTVQHIIAEDSIFGEFLRDQAMSGIDFLELAEEYYPGEESIRRDLANLGEIGPGDMPESFYQGALKTAVGEVSHPIETEFGYHVIKVLRRVDSVDYRDARMTIMPVLKEDHAARVLAAFRQRLFNEFDVRFPTRLAPVHLKPLDYRQEGR